MGKSSPSITLPVKYKNSSTVATTGNSFLRIASPDKKKLRPWHRSIDKKVSFRHYSLSDILTRWQWHRRAGQSRASLPHWSLETQPRGIDEQNFPEHHVSTKNLTLWHIGTKEHVFPEHPFLAEILSLYASTDNFSPDITFLARYWDHCPVASACKSSPSITFYSFFYWNVTANGSGSCQTPVSHIFGKSHCSMSRCGKSHCDTSHSTKMCSPRRIRKNVLGASIIYLRNYSSAPSPPKGRWEKIRV